MSGLEELRDRLEEWRESGRKGRRIPEALWEAATELARDAGVSRVAQALGLSYESLKRRVGTTEGVEAKALPAAVGPAFVELALGGIAPGSACVIERQDRRGKLTIRLADSNPQGVAAVVEAIWRAER